MEIKSSKLILILKSKQELKNTKPLDSLSWKRRENWWSFNLYGFLLADFGRLFFNVFFNKMPNNSIWTLLPLTGAVIGWLTNFIAIKLLFVPRKKTFGIQGLIPRRKEKIAEKIAKTGLKFLPDKIEKLTKVPLIGKGIIAYIENELKKKVHSMSDKEIQEIIENVAKKELVFIQISGAVLGAIVGLIQAGIIYFIY